MNLFEITNLKLHTNKLLRIAHQFKVNLSYFMSQIWHIILIFITS